jgi:hypothetical protein
MTLKQELANIVASLKEVEAGISFITHPDLIALVNTAYAVALAQARATADALGCRSEFEKHYSSPPTAH